jgi:hypothetical protein
LYGIFKRLCPQADDRKKLTMPRVLTLYQKCVEHKIQDCLIKQLHFNDLYVLILSLDITDIKQSIRNKQAQERKNAPNVRDIPQADAVKFLKGGG